MYWHWSVYYYSEWYMFVVPCLNYCKPVQPHLSFHLHWICSTLCCRLHFRKLECKIDVCCRHCRYLSLSDADVSDLILLYFPVTMWNILFVLQKLECYVMKVWSVTEEIRCDALTASPSLAATETILKILSLSFPYYALVFDVYRE